MRMKLLVVFALLFVIAVCSSAHAYPSEKLEHKPFISIANAVNTSIVVNVGGMSGRIATGQSFEATLELGTHYEVKTGYSNDPDNIFEVSTVYCEASEDF